MPILRANAAQSLVPLPVRQVGSAHALPCLFSYQLDHAQNSPRALSRPLQLHIATKPQPRRRPRTQARGRGLQKVQQVDLPQCNAVPSSVLRPTHRLRPSFNASLQSNADQHRLPCQIPLWEQKMS